jgi:hypothetical protein
MVEDDARCPKCGRVDAPRDAPDGWSDRDPQGVRPRGFTTERPPVLEEPAG